MELEGVVAEGVVVIGASVPCGPVRCDLGVEAHEVRVREAELGNRRERRGGEIYVAEVGEEGASGRPGGGEAAGVGGMAGGGGRGDAKPAKVGQWHAGLGEGAGALGGVGGANADDVEQRLVDERVMG